MGGGGGIGGMLGGGGLGGLLGGVGGLLQTFAPLANLVMPGFGPMIAQAAGGLLQGAGNFVSKMEQEQEDQKAQDRRMAWTKAVANTDMERAEKFLVA